MLEQGIGEFGGGTPFVSVAHAEPASDAKEKSPSLETSSTEVVDSEVEKLVHTFARPDRQAMSDALETIKGLSSERKALVAMKVVKTIESGPLSTRWDSYRAGPFGVAIAFAAPYGFGNLLDFGDRFSTDRERREWVNRIIGEVFRRDKSKRLPTELNSRAVAFLLASIAMSQPEDSLVWSAVESLGEMGAAAHDAVAILKDVLSKNRSMDPRVGQIYRKSISQIEQK